MKTWQKVAWFVVPAVIGVGLIIWIKKGARNPEDDGNSPGKESNATDKTAPPVKTVAATKNPAFPLANGSRNSYVTQLQQALGITADGIFGPITEQNLRNATGLSVIRDEKEFNEVIGKIKSTATSVKDIAEKTTRAAQLSTQFQTGRYSIMPEETKIWNQVNKDAFGAYIPTGLGITMYKGTKYNKADYIISDYTKLGNLIITVNKGAAMGSYTGDPRTITLV